MTDPAEVQQEYERRFSERAEYRDQVWRILTREFFQKEIPVGSTVLDVGCGWGEFINNIEAATKIAIDLNPDAADRVSADVSLLSQNCADPWGVEPSSIDVVFSSNFFEHLLSVGDLKKTLTSAFEALRPGGKLIALGPNIKFTHGAYWDFIDHHIPLTEASLSELLELVGFRVERAVPRFLPYTMSSGRQYPAAFLRLYLRLPFLWRFVGAQFLVVAHKPAK